MNVKYISTRGAGEALGFEEVLLAGLARDGGLYLPETWPVFSAGQMSDFANASFTDIAYMVMAPYCGDEVESGVLRTMIEDAYKSFSHPATAPLVQIDDQHFILELFHGPTLAFKDVAMQILARLMDQALVKRGQRATIVGATSGDTGGAAIEAFRGREAIDIFILHPHGRVSDVQRKQMTTVQDDNVFNIALEGSFDDCQAIVKALFNDLAFRDDMRLSGVNSINWARIMAQITYYFTAARSLGGPHRKINFAVPTGNFGDIFAGYCAHKMGLPIGELMIATNVNDILVRCLDNGRYDPQGVIPTYSPSMDIQISSNFERLLFEITGRDAARIKSLMADLQEGGAFQLSSTEQDALKELFSACRVDEEETTQTIKTLYQETGYIADPHSAIGVAAARNVAAAQNKNREANAQTSAPMVSLATAHPAKFPDIVEKMTGQAISLPPALAEQFKQAERVNVLPNDIKHVAHFIRQNSRAQHG